MKSKMNYDELMSIKIIPKEIAQSQSKAFANSLYHTPYRDEIRLFSCIKQGNLKKLIFEIKQLGIQNITVGQMSADDLQQRKYMAVSFITLATRYAIQGGLNESSAYHFSDDFILKIDKAKTKATIYAAIVDGAIELTNRVSREQKNLNYSPHIRRSIAYINKNLDKRLTVNSVAEHCGLSSDYLSHLFKEKMGVNLSGYIMHQKLELSQAMLWDGYDNEKICYTLGFSSQSHFISSFKKEYGITPGEYIAMIR